MKQTTFFVLTIFFILTTILHAEKQECKMHFPQNPDSMTTGIDVFTCSPLFLADDFKCTETGLITDITIWTSWFDDWLPDNQPNFNISIWSDNPEGPNGYSQPYQEEWSMLIIPDNYYYEIYEETYEGEWWFNITTGEFYFPGDYIIWQYNISIPESLAFEQQNGTIYWLCVQAELIDPGPAIGWKTSIDHWNDGAVWTDTLAYWNELIYPSPHQWVGGSMDLAFVISGNPSPDELDFGDAPDTVAGMFPTLLANDGARHILDGQTYLGTLIDAETDGLQSTDALGDDNDNFDDEDGVTFMSCMVPGGTTEILLTASIDGFLNAWVDFNCDYDWDDSDEQILNDATLFAGTNTLTFDIPASAVPGTSFARFRFNMIGGLSYDGLATDGEVEDYMVVIYELIEPVVSIFESSDTMYVTWDSVPCATSYIVYSSTDPYVTFPSGWTVEATGITGTSWCEKVSGLTKKFYKVVAVK